MEIETRSTTGASSPSSRGLSRRTVVTAAAWSAPALVLATATPAHAASVGDVLAFTAPSYAGTACGTVAVQVSLTRGGAPVASEPITLALVGGYTFAGGATSAVANTNASGIATFSVRVPNTGGNSTISASAVTPGAPLSAVAPVTAQAALVTAALHQNATAGATTTYANLPIDTKPVATSYFLRADGGFYGGTTLLTSGVTSADGLRSSGNNWAATIDGAGVHRIYRNGDLVSTSVPVPALVGAKAIGVKYALTPSGALYWHNAVNAMAEIATGVTSADSSNNGAENYVGAVTGTTLTIYNESTVYATRTVASGSSAIGAFHWLSGSSLFYAAVPPGGTLVRSDVVSANGESRSDGHWVGVITSEPQHRTYVNGGNPSGGASARVVPAGSTPVGVTYALSPAGDLYVTATPFLTGIASAAGATDPMANWVTVVRRPAACPV